MAALYDFANPALEALVPEGSRDVLDLGCGSGRIGAQLRAALGCRVTGVTWSEDEASAAAEKLDRVVIADLNVLHPATLGRFDCIVCSHVLEHLVDPAALLRRCREAFVPHGKLVVALPNVLHVRQRFEFLRGRFDYTETGQLDRTHLRFFVPDTAAALLEEAGYAIEIARADGWVPRAHYLGARLKARIDAWGLARWPGLFAQQMLFVAAPRR